MGKIICPGELLIDFVCTDVDINLANSINFIKKAGGAPANVCAAITKLGAKANFVGKVGKDQFGDFLVNEMEKYNVDMKNCIRAEKSTTLAFVSLDSQGERDFSFVRGADEELKIEEVDFKSFEDANIIHLGSATALLGGDLYEVYKEFINFAKENNKLISFDPNFRDALFGDKVELFRERCIEVLKYTDLLKISLEEGQVIANAENLEEILDTIHDFGAKVITITLGKEGTVLSIKKKKEKIGSIKVNMIDATGAGDAFIGSVLAQLSKEENSKEACLDEDKMREIIKIANIVGAKTTENYGAIDSIPSIEELKDQGFIK